MQLDDTLPCSACVARTQAGTMRYNQIGTKLLCEKCYLDEQGTARQP